MAKAKYKWEDVGEREWFEINTEGMQYFYRPDGVSSQTGFGIVGTKDLPWVVEVKIQGAWVFVGEFRTAKEAKAKAISNYEIAHEQGWISVCANLPDFNTWVIVQLDRSGVSGEVWLAQLYPDGVWRFGGQGYVVGNVTHWQPLPIPVHSCRDYISEIGENYESRVVTLRCIMCGETWKEEVPQ